MCDEARQGGAEFLVVWKVLFESDVRNPVSFLGFFIENPFPLSVLLLVALI